MSKDMKTQLIERGVSQKQLALIRQHSNDAQQYVVDKKMTFGQAVDKLAKAVGPLVTPKNLKLIKTAFDMTTEPKVKYLEGGLLDSAQTSREASKILSTLISAGQFLSEAGILGKKPNPVEIGQLFGINISLKPDDLEELKSMPAVIGSDLLFPGVTPSKDEPVDFEGVAYSTLLGHAPNSVRLPFGVGGLRYDKEWNYQMTLAPYTQEKIDEDKRVYPGTATLYLMLQNLDSLGGLPLLSALYQGNPEAFAKLQGFLQTVKGDDTTIKDKANLCALYIPSQKETEEVISHGIQLQGNGSNGLFVPLYRAYHSPSDVYRKFLHLMQFLKQGNTKMAGVVVNSLPNPGTVYNFNGVFHLPWVQELQYLTDGLIGKIHGKDGIYAVRFGIGDYRGSKEFQVYHLGNNGYAIKSVGYTDPEFTDNPTSKFLIKSEFDGFLDALQTQGFLSFMDKGGEIYG